MIDIKQLVWEPYLTGFEANSIMGVFRVYGGQWRLDGNTRFGTVGVTCRDNATAMASAQAWFGAKIRAQIAPVTPVEDEELFTFSSLWDLGQYLQSKAERTEGHGKELEAKGLKKAAEIVAVSKIVRLG